MKSYTNLTPSEKIIELDTFIESSKKTVDVFKQKLLSGYGTPEDAKLLREWENHLWSQQLTRTELIQENKEWEMIKKVFKYSDSRNLFIEVGILNAKDEVLFHSPHPRYGLKNITFYLPDFFIKNEEGEYKEITSKTSRREITTDIEDLKYSLGYIDQNDSVVFYDQYL